MSRQFLIVFDELPVEKTDVKRGDNVPEVVTACRCVNVGLFVSNNLRRNVVLTIAFGKRNDLRVISFPGETLRRVSPDERSISFFILKAKDILSGLEIGMSKTMDNGIIVERYPFQQLIEKVSPENIYIASEQFDSVNYQSDLESDGLFIYDIDGILGNNVGEIIRLP